MIFYHCHHIAKTLTAEQIITLITLNVLCQHLSHIYYVNFKLNLFTND